jgi:putative lipoic acid-binding regulatory protein
MATQTQATVVPLVSSGTAGPLGAIHLPRLWLKLSLAAKGALPESYDECGAGFDAMTLRGLGLDREKTIDFVRQRRPTYMEFEEWVVANGKTDKGAIEQHNAAIRAYNHGDDLASSMRESSKIKNSSVKDAVTLNTIEDLDEIHQQINQK